MQLNFKSIHLFGHFTSLCPAIHSPPLSPRHSYPWRQKNPCLEPLGGKTSDNNSDAEGLSLKCLIAIDLPQSPLYFHTILIVLYS